MLGVVEQTPRHELSDSKQSQIVTISDSNNRVVSCIWVCTFLFLPMLIPTFSHALLPLTLPV